MIDPQSHTIPEQNIKGLKIFLFFLAAVYLLNCLSPLRLHLDMLRYFAIKDCIELGCAPDSEAAKDYLPFGYTALLLFLSKLNILHSWSVIFINCLFLFGAMYWVKDLLAPGRYIYISFILVLLNWVTIKFATHPLSEMQYTFFSIGALAFFYSYAKNKNLWSLLLAFIFAGLAFFTRSVGIALVAALLTSLVWLYRTELKELLRRNKALVGILIAIIIGVLFFSKQLGLQHYTGVFTKQFDEGIHFSDLMKWHFTEWAEISLNTSLARVEAMMPFQFGKTAFMISGVFFFVCFVYLIFIRKSEFPFVIKAYVFFYSVLLFTWPFYDPRFWVPVIPLIIPLVVHTLQSIRIKLVRILVWLFLIIYMIEGMVAVGYYSYTSLNKKVLVRTQAGGTYRNDYETAFFGKPLTDTATHINQEAVSVIRRYN